MNAYSGPRWEKGETIVRGYRLMRSSPADLCAGQHFSLETENPWVINCQIGQTVTEQVFENSHGAEESVLCAAVLHNIAFPLNGVPVLQNLDRVKCTYRI